MMGLVGALTVGRYSDKLVVRWRAKRGGKWYPEDRLRAAIPGALVIAPLSVLLSGLFITYVPGRLGVILNLLCLFLNGIGESLLSEKKNERILNLFTGRCCSRTCSGLFC